jgi:2-amino-4-hydroxy-6-hydroxymethyldihydropteridine diphosphokinase
MNVPKSGVGTQRRAYLGIGSNLGDRLANLQSAVDGLAMTNGVAVHAVSRVYATDPVGGPEQDEYLNAVVAIDTDLNARELLGVGQHLEQAAGRVRAERWGPRTLDVDILVIDGETVDEPDLQVPHPRLRERGFVMAPLADVAPDVTPPPAGWPGVHDTDLSLRVP